MMRQFVCLKSSKARGNEIKFRELPSGFFREGTFEKKFKMVVYNEGEVGGGGDCLVVTVQTIPGRVLDDASGHISQEPT